MCGVQATTSHSADVHFLLSCEVTGNARFKAAEIIEEINTVKEKNLLLLVLECLVKTQIHLRVKSKLTLLLEGFAMKQTNKQAT